MGKANVTIDDQLRRLARQAQQELGRTLMARARRGGQAVLADAIARWPVDTGRSRASLHLIDAPDRVGGEIGIEDRVWYVPLIHGGATWNELVVGPMGRVAADVSRNSGPEIIAALKVS